MEWSAEQNRAMKEMSKFLRDPNRFIFRLWGDAGTGKTSLVHQVRDDHDDLHFIACAYTGKAASRLRAKGWDNACTFHSKLFIPGQSSRARLKAWIAELEELGQKKQAATNADDLKVLNQIIEDLRDKIADEEEALKAPVFIYNQENELKDYDVIVCDEASMIDWGLGKVLEDKLAKEHKVKIIAMGDPWQLPPVEGKPYFMQVQPDFQLTEVHRQAKDDPILWLAQKAKNQEPLPLGSYGTSRVISRLDPEECLQCTQLLVGKNDTRKYYNKRLRELRGYTDDVEAGEKLMCLMNNKNGGFFNGTIWYVQDVHGIDEYGEHVIVDVAPDDDMEETRYQVKLHISSLRSGDKVDWRDLANAQCMTACQAATVHKFQGSEGKHIVLYNESRAAARANWHKWLYTGITRAQERITVVDE